MIYIERRLWRLRPVFAATRLELCTYDRGFLLVQRGSESVAVRRVSLTKPQGWQQVSDYRVLYVLQYFVCNGVSNKP